MSDNMTATDMNFKMMEYFLSLIWPLLYCKY